MKAVVWASALLMVACGDGPGFDEPAIRSVLSEQEAAWDRGDINGYMAGYSDSICFIGRRGRTCGKKAVTRNYVESYPDRSAMGDLDFTILEITPAGARHAWASGLWRLYRTADTLDGGFSLLWAKEPGGWRIIRDHSY